MKRFLLFYLPFLCLGAGVTHADAPMSQPNVVVIVADDLSRTLCNFLPEGQGKTLMPHLDRLAAEGTVLAAMHSPSPVCTPSRYAILTGRYPSRSRSHEFLQEIQRDGQAVVGFNTHIVPGETTLQQRMRERGYVTGAFGKNHTVEVSEYKRLPYDSQLDDPGVMEQLTRNASALKKAFLASGFDEADRLYHGNPDADGIKVLAVHNQDWVTEGALDFIAKHHARPFFLYMATTIPHGPFEKERSWQGDPRITPEGLLPEAEIPQGHPARETIDQRLKEAGIKRWNTGQVLWLDDAVGAIVKQLEEHHIDDNTIIVFLSDHGTEAKGGAYLGGTLTAAVVWRKGGFPVGARATAQLQLTDLAPTVLEWAGTKKQQDHIDGVSFHSVLDGTTQEVRDTLYFEMGYSRAVIHNGFKYLALRYPARAQNMPLAKRKQILDKTNATLSARGRPLRTTDPTAPFSHIFLIPGGHDVDQSAVNRHPAFFAEDQLYDLQADPEEQSNLATNPAHAEKLRTMRQLLAAQLHTKAGEFGEFKTNKGQP